MQILALSGSLRAASLNTALLKVAAQIAPHEMHLSLFPGLGDLPLFNSDLEADFPPPATRLRQQIASSDAVLIASPEYAHGISGVLKNGLDWMVGTEAFVGKPVAVLNASPRATHAHAALCEVLTTMSAQVIDAASVTVPVLGSHRHQADMLADDALVAALRQALEQLALAISSRLFHNE